MIRHIEKLDYKVLVRCFTYNHSKYISDALDGFAKQVTDFPFVCLIMDDYSSDGNQEVIKNYIKEHCKAEDIESICAEVADVIIAPLQDNPNCTFVVYFLRQNLNKDLRKYMIVRQWRDKCQYEALCEGDDYWIETFKLQKQVDFLEIHLDYSMCFHKVAMLSYIPTLNAWKQFRIAERDYSADELFENWIVPTCSILVKKEVYNQQIKNRDKILNGDIFCVLRAAACGKVHAFADTMAVYRIQQGGITYSEKAKRNRLMKYPDHFECIKENFPFLSQRLINKKLAYSLCYRAKQKNNPDKIKDMTKALSLRPTILFEIIAKKTVAMLKRLLGLML